MAVNSWTPLVLLGDLGLLGAHQGECSHGQGEEKAEAGGDVIDGHTDERDGSIAAHQREHAQVLEEVLNRDRGAHSSAVVALLLQEGIQRDHEETAADAHQCHEDEGIRQAMNEGQ